jgi:uncharacterized RDD family membrane protein YckC
MKIDDEEIVDKLSNEGIDLSTVNKRATAFVIDDMIISVLFMIIFFDKFKALSGDIEGMVSFMNSIFLYMISVKTLYQTIFIGLYGQTIGKMVMKIKVINVDYLDNPDFFESFQRAIGRVVSEVVFYLGFIWANFTPSRQTWHDKLAKTIVVDV